jgi:hypothetical protein
LVKVTIEEVGSQLVMRVVRPEAVLPLLLPVLVGIWSPTLIGQTVQAGRVEAAADLVRVVVRAVGVAAG